ncbi:MAG: type 1 glutamine amidotransferase [Gammaproteobacteria bacterium]|nr:type 1 glutamine amidotransferase [Gammaproteobacteria bacterium]MBT8152246.1 type 1 glutamine amidotransferase [Gammaproteobacteria bacterium]NND39669.1 type 1 glutamine amidotransferase [Pseudomonadales bacterium]NNL11410.1 type 1 glutamine amidotransferase [Pseudomonadales bacterium]NNM12631.1 type 1 glutamine amidotransferase [Pseudomonadales bacterium]
MKLLVLQHVPFEGPAAIKAWADGHGHPVTHHCCASDTEYPDPGCYDACIIMGGPMGVNDAPAWMDAELAFIRSWLDSGKFLLGICLGAQLIAAALGANVSKHHCREIGWFELQRCGNNPASTGQASWVDRALPAQFEALHWHGDSFALPEGARHLYRSAACEHQAFAIGNRVLGLQFHLEFDLSTAERVADACADELQDSSPTVQSRAQLMSNKVRFDTANRLMHQLLDAMRLEFMRHNL